MLLFTHFSQTKPIFHKLNTPTLLLFGLGRAKVQLPTTRMRYRVISLANAKIPHFGLFPAW
jgi:hypothetical protein